MSLLKNLNLRRKLGHLGKACHLGDGIRTKYGKLVWIGDKVTIGDKALLYAHPEDKRRTEPIITIGSGSHLSEFNYLSARSGITIGTNVLFSAHVLVIDHSHAFTDIHTPIMHQPVDSIKPVTIGDGSWIGMHAAILPGAKIGRNCVIGVGSVVNTVIPDYCVAVGSPARIVKHFDPATGAWVKGAPSDTKA